MTTKKYNEKLKSFYKKVLFVIKWPWNEWKEYRNIRKRLKKAKEQDPYIYK